MWEQKMRTEKEPNPKEEEEAGGVVWCGVVWCGVVWCGVVWCGVVWCGVVWCTDVLCGEGVSTTRKKKAREDGQQSTAEVATP
jgi:hypothetical protein